MCTARFRGQRIESTIRSARKVLDDFTDEQGRPLSATVGNLRLGVGARLWDLLFVDGTEEALCADSATAAFTTLRGRVVYVCAARFASSAQPLTGLAGEILVIHEFLHSLGLPESPSTPGAFTSAQITERVWARCGDARGPEVPQSTQLGARGRGSRRNR